MSTDKQVAKWVTVVYGMDFASMNDEAKARYRALYSGCNPVQAQSQNSLNERLLTLLCRALDGSMAIGNSSTASGVTHDIRSCINLIRTSNAIERHAEDGKIKVVESGRDCDGVEYDGATRVIQASLEAFEKLNDEIGEYADGPFRLEIIPMSDSPEYTTRDLVMEAREDGRTTLLSRFA